MGDSSSSDFGASGAPLMQDQSGMAHQEWSVRMANAAMERYSSYSERWCYEYGVLLKSLEQVWLRTGEDRYYDYVKLNADRFVDPDGDINTYRIEDYNLDQINAGKVLFPLHARTGDDRYAKAAYLLREQ